MEKTIVMLICLIALSFVFASIASATGIITQSPKLGAVSINNPTLPDFVAISLDVPSKMFVGNTYLVNFTIYNNGTDVSIPHNHTLHSNPECNPPGPPSNCPLEDYQTFTSHPANTYRTVSFSFTPTFGGTYYLKACADGDSFMTGFGYEGCNFITGNGQVVESNENNNAILKLITVQNTTYPPIPPIPPS